MLLESAFDGLDETGWRKLSRNWAWFFLFLAALNEVLRHALTFDGWLAAKVWGVSALSFLFTFVQIPMLLRHGLGGEQAVEEAETTTPTIERGTAQTGPALATANHLERE
jgi:intracellular septation protein